MTEDYVRLEDGKDYYVCFVHPKFWEDYKEALNPWPEIYRKARAQLSRIGLS